MDHVTTGFYGPGLPLQVLGKSVEVSKQPLQVLGKSVEVPKQPLQALGKSVEVSKQLLQALGKSVEVSKQLLQHLIKFVADPEMVLMIGYGKRPESRGKRQERGRGRSAQDVAATLKKPPEGGSPYAWMPA